MKKLINILEFILLISVLGCKNYEPDTMNLGAMKMEDDEQTIIKNIETESETQIDKKLIKNGDVEFESENLTETRENILKAIEKFKETR